MSNRLPVSVGRDQDGALTFTASSGGLATAMSSLNQRDKIWIGWPGIADDDLTDDEKQQITDELAKQQCIAVHLSAQQIERFYEGYANDTLWPLFHYFQAASHHNHDNWLAYQQVNQKFADAIVAVSSAHGSIWVHDYHFMLLPKMIRQQLPQASIGFFLHIPFPSFEIYRLLPQRKELLEGLLGADLVGFHIYDYGRHFLSSCLRLLGVSSSKGVMQYQEREIAVDAYPIGIDYVKFQQSLDDITTKQAMKKILDANKHQSLIISVDRLDYSKGIPERLDAFNMLLENHPEYIGKVRLQMVAVPSRIEVETYQQLRDTIEQAVSRINGTYGTADWAPISYQFQNLPFSEIVGLYAAADVALVTPLRDGMNLVAKEYVASKRRRPGVLILSEMAGAIDELPEAISINPSDTESVASALHQALTMPKKEQLYRISAMQRRLKSYTVQAWGKDFMHDLKKATQASVGRKRSMSTEDLLQVVSDYKQASSRLILLDYDGTLKSFVKSPRPIMAAPSLLMRRLIRKLAHEPGTELAIVSGRTRKALAGWFRDSRITLVAEHGAWIRNNGVWSHVDDDFNPTKALIRPILDDFASKTTGSLVEVKEHALVWHYRNVPTELAYARANELKRTLISVIKDESIGVFSGNKIIEIRPTAINKGFAVMELVTRHSPDMILCIGDDYTDEDMFRELPASAHTIKVGSGDTKARFRLPSVARVVRLLEDLAAAK
ncbi:MAG: bifunctional alpha,alpha-trehalose-phosphate synthase (UDP-forming)/trehalose-phosphatase [Candidatus Saccharimonadales bacterium]